LNICRNDFEDKKKETMYSITRMAVTGQEIKFSIFAKIHLSIAKQKEYTRERRKMGERRKKREGRRERRGIGERGEKRRER
jgi:hypothetical protein